ncbi:MAG: tetratricopeptide repeat protein, partial [bacterium]|nr:tetratricopeptide repeat protein [bacterium]
ALNPASPVVHSRYAWYFLAPRMRLEEASQELELALDSDPLGPLAHEELGRIEMFRRQYDRAAELLRKAVELDPTSPAAHASLAATYLFQGNMELAFESTKEMVRLAGNHPEVVAARAAQLTMMGRAGEAAETLERLRQMSRVTYVSPLAFAWVAMSMQDDAVFEWLEKAVEERDPQALHLPAKPIYDGLRSHPRFQSLMAGMGLAPGSVSD